MFKIGDKVIAIKHSPKGVHHPLGLRPVLGKIYVIADVWRTSIGPLLIPVGFGEAPIINGYKTGWNCKNFRKLDTIKKRNARKQTNSSYAIP